MHVTYIFFVMAVKELFIESYVEYRVITRWSDVVITFIFAMVVKELFIGSHVEYRGITPSKFEFYVEYCGITRWIFIGISRNNYLDIYRTDFMITFLFTDTSFSFSFYLAIVFLSI